MSVLMNERWGWLIRGWVESGTGIYKPLTHILTVASAMAIRYQYTWYILSHISSANVSIHGTNDNSVTTVRPWSSEQGRNNVYLAQLVERMLSMHEVEGSKPSSSKLFHRLYMDNYFDTLIILKSTIKFRTIKQASYNNENSVNCLVVKIRNCI